MDAYYLPNSTALNYDAIGSLGNIFKMKISDIRQFGKFLKNRKNINF